MSYLAYQPPGYEASSPARYPVLYMLHGSGGGYTEWASYGLLVAADHLMQRGEIPPFLIVLPEGDRAYWVDHANGGPAWGTYMAREVVAVAAGDLAHGEAGKPGPREYGAGRGDELAVKEAGRPWHNWTYV